jgi:multidrug efflux pump subunit AcrA (membrane-fusion protein)
MEFDHSTDNVETAGQTARKFGRGRALWYMVALTLVLVAALGLVLLLTRGSRSNGIAGRPVPAPSSDVFGSASGATPRPGEMVIALGPERTENAHLKYAVAEASSESRAEAEGVRTTGTVQSNAYKEVPVLPVVGGIVKQVNVELGERVKRGQVLATIFSNELAESQAAYLGLQAEAERHHAHYSRTA